MKKILIIDYDQNSLASLQGVFAAGYEVVTAADGQSGWDRYNKECPDLVLMEAMLPKVHGFELCQRITSERNSRTTVFIMTGVYKDRVYRTEALRTYGAAEYFEKPLKMAELMASVEAVLGKPEVRPAEARPAAPPPAAVPPMSEVRAEPPAAELHRRPKSDDSIFALPEDLDRLSREHPKARKPGPARVDPASEQKFEAMADQLLKTVIVESAAPKTVTPKPGGGNGNGNGNGRGGADIDQFLKSALADLDFEKSKAKTAKPATPPAPVAPPRPAAPPAAPARPAPPEFKPAPPQPPSPKKPLPDSASADMKNTLTPGDPGTDVSPFFTPRTVKPVHPPAQAEKKPAPAPRPADVPKKPEPARPQPETRPAAKPVVPAAEPKTAEALPVTAGAIFRDIEGPVEKKGPSKIVVIVLGVLALAALGFFLLRAKRPAPVDPAPQETSGTMTQSEATSKPVEDPPPPTAKPAPAKQKAQPQVKPAEQAGAQAILPAQTASLALPPPGESLGASPVGGADGAPAGSRTEDPASSAVKTGTEPSANPASGPATAPESAPAAVSPAPVPVKEGDLVELAAVTEAPKLTKRVDPIYPQTAQRVGRAGAVTVNALIDEKGNVADTAILKGIQDDKGLVRAAETAVRKWKFQPARKDGVAVRVWKPIVITFKADANPANEV